MHLQAHDETGPGTASATAHLHGVEQSAEATNKQIEGMGQAASRGAAEASMHLNGLKNSLGDIAKMATGFALGGIMTQLGGGFAGVVESSIDKAKEFSGQVKSLQMVMGGTPEEVSTTVSAFERFGVSSERAAASLSFFARNIQKVPIDIAEMAANIDETTGKPLKGFAETMRTMGVATEDASGAVRPMMDIFLDSADAFKAMGNGGDAASKAMTLFGRAGRDMLPLLMQGKEGIKAAAEEAAKFGLQLTTTNMAQIKAFSNANKDLNEAMSGLKLQIGIALMPVLTALASIGAKLAEIFNQNLLPAVKSVSDWIGKLVDTVKDAWDRFTLWLAPLGDAKDRLLDLLGTIMDTNVNGQKLSDVLTNLAIGMVATGATATIAGIGVDQLGNALDFVGNTAQTVTAIFDAGVWGTFFAALVLIGGAAYVAYTNLDWFKEIVDSLALALTDDAGAMGYVYDALKKTFGQGLADQLNPFLNWFMKAIPLVKDLGRAIVVAFTEDKGAIGVVYDVVRKLFGDSVAEFVQPFLEKLRLFIPVLQDVGTWLGYAFGDLFSGDIKNALIDLEVAFFKLTGIDLSGLVETVGAFFDKISKGDISGALGPLGPLFDKLSEFFDKLSKGDIEGALGPLGEGFHSMKDALEKIGGALATLWPHPLEDMLNGFVALVKVGEDNGPSTVQKGFDALTGTLEKLVGFVNGVAKGFDDTVIAMGHVGDEVRTNPLLQDALAVILGGLAGYFLAIGINAGLAALGILAASIASGALALAAGAAAIATGLLAGALAILASPFILIMIVVFAVAALLVTLYKNNETFRTSVDNLWEGLKKLGGYLGTGFMAALDALDSTKWKFKPNFQVGPFHWDETGAWFEDPRKMVTDWLAALQGAATSNPAPVDLGAGSTTGGSALSQTLDAIERSRAANIAAREAAATGGASQVSPNPTITRALGGWLREPIVGVGESGTRYMLHANEYVSPAGGLSDQAAAANAGNGPYDVIPRGVDALADAMAARRARGDISLNIGPGAVVINGTTSAVADIAAAADGLWDDLYGKLSRALDNRPLGAGA